MNDALRMRMEKEISAATGRPGRIVEHASLDGGCINHASRVDFEDGRVFLAKWNPSPLPNLFEREAEGLQILHEAGAIRVPRPICTAGAENDGAAPFIVLEYIQSGRQGPGFFETFGRQFASLHRETTTTRYGFAHDNYLGSTPQPNTWNNDWVDFYRKNRLGFQLDLARRNGLADAAFSRLGDRLLDRLDELIAEPAEPPCLLHGDLWGGNYLVGQKGEPVLIDPAAYYGRREADIAMTRLFGAFDARFYSAYEEIWPLADGSEARIDIYRLYHILNHLNLFGSSYHAGCLSILKRYAGN